MVRIHKWKETPGEKSLRVKGHREEKNAVIETGTQFGLDLLRVDKASEAVMKVMKCLHGLKQAAADHKWDDEKCVVVIGVQIRNGWVKDVDGEWCEEGSNRWLDKIAGKAKD